MSQIDTQAVTQQIQDKQELEDYERRRHEAFGKHCLTSTGMKNSRKCLLYITNSRIFNIFLKHKN